MSAPARDDTSVIPYNFKNIQDITIIAEILWNYRRQYIYYQIFTDEHLSGKWYKNDDLELI